MVIAWLAARVRNKLRGPRALCARAVGGLLDNRQIAEDDPDQRIEALIQAIADSVGAIGGEAGHDAKLQPPAPDPHAATVSLPAGDEAEAGPAPPPPGPGPAPGEPPEGPGHRFARRAVHAIPARL